MGLELSTGSPTQFDSASMSTRLYTDGHGGIVEKLKTLNALPEMTKEAGKLASEGDEMERIKTLIAEIRRKAQQEHERIRGDQGRRESPDPPRYELCMIGIREEFSHGPKSIPNMPTLSASLSRIREEIDRTIKGIEAKSSAM